MNSSLMKKPSAFLPVVMSMAALSLVLIHVARFGTAQQADEGTSAHLWQLLMALQVPFIGFFAVKWLPQSPKHASLVLALQFAAAAAALFPVWWLQW